MRHSLQDETRGTGLGLDYPVQVHRRYGTGYELGSNNVGLVFKLTPSNGGWTYTLLHEFAVGDGGDFPIGSLVLDAQGNLYGTATGGGAYGYGVVWEITP